MAQLGKKIYYEKTNGIKIWERPEMEGAVQETTLEQDKLSTPILNLISASQLGVKYLNYGDLTAQFASCKGYRINPLTEEVEFAY
jgi:hypothetical protein